MPNRVYQRLFLLVGGCALSVLAPLQFADAVTVEEIEQAWRQRQQKFRSVDLAWMETQVVVRTEADLQGGPIGPTEEQVRRLGDKKHNFEHTCAQRLVFEGKRIRYEDNGRTWHVEEKQLTDLRQVTVFNGETGKRLRHREEANWPYQGSAGPSDSKRVHQLVFERWAIKPLRFFFQPFVLDAEVLRPYRIADAERQLGDVRCTILRRILPARVPVVASLWLDRDAGFVVARYTEERDGLVVGQLDVTYDRDPQRGPIPKAWTHAEYTSEGGIRFAVRAEVTSLNQ